MNIRTFWKDVTNKELDKISEYSFYEWLILRRLYSGGRMGGSEISENDLLQSFPSEKLGEAKNAVRSLERKQILVKKPKPNDIIYQAKPGFFANDPVVVCFIKKIIENRDLRVSLIDKTLELTRTSEVLMRVVADELIKNRKHIIDQRVEASEDIAFDGDLGVRISLTIKCPNNSRFKIEYVAVEPHELRHLTFRSRCDCGLIHQCGAFGKVF
jgi:hypothetical protein